MPFADHRYVIAHIENMKRRVLTYNVCWGCMTNEGQDASALELAMRCKHDKCLLQVAANIDRANEASVEAGDGPLLAVGLQEATRYADLQAKSRVLNSMQLFAHQKHAEEQALFLDASLRVTWSGVGAVSRRPLQVALAESEGGHTLLFVNLHNNHHYKGTAACIQTGIANLTPQPPHSRIWSDILSHLPEHVVVIAMGDWNEFHEPFRLPFALCKTAPRHVQTMSLRSDNQPPLSCCSTSEYPRKSFKQTADYVLSNRGAINVLAPLASLGDASDHLPVMAIISLAQPQIAAVHTHAELSPELQGQKSAPKRRGTSTPSRDRNPVETKKAQDLPLASSAVSEDELGQQKRGPKPLHTPLHHWILGGLAGVTALGLFLKSRDPDNYRRRLRY